MNEEVKDYVANQKPEIKTTFSDDGFLTVSFYVEEELRDFVSDLIKHGRPKKYRARRLDVDESTWIKFLINKMFVEETSKHNLPNPISVETADIIKEFVRDFMNNTFDSLHDRLDRIENILSCVVDGYDNEDEES